MRLWTGLAFAALVLVQAEALRFAHFPVTADTEILIVGRPSQLTCNYVKFRTESVREISWFAGYSDMKMKVFHYKVAADEREVGDNEFIEVDPGSATATSLTVTLPEFRNPEMTIGCEVAVLRDSGYGSVRHSKKMSEANITVADTRGHQLILKPGPPSASLRELAQNRFVTVGKPMTVTCFSTGSMPPPNLTLSINGVPIEGMYGGRVDVLPYDGGLQKIAATGYLDSVTDREFQDEDVLIVECVAKFQDYLLKKKQLALKKSYETQELKRGPRQWEDPRAERDQRRVGSTDEMLRQRLLDMIYPGRHVHPGIPYDFFAGYIVLVADRLTSDRQVYSNVLGKLPRKVQRELEEKFGYFEQVGQHHARMKMPPVDVLNLLGSLGYRVIGTSSPEQKEMVWTLEHRNYEELATRNEI